MLLGAGLCMGMLLAQSIAGSLLTPILESFSLEPRQQPGAVAADVYLRRAGHAIIVVGNYLYIDGGQFSYENNHSVVFEYSTTTLSIDLSKDWTNDSVVLVTIQKPPAAPNLYLPQLWYHEAENLIYGGICGTSANTYIDDSNAVAPLLSLWSFSPDGAGQGRWSEDITSSNSSLKNITRPVQVQSAYGPDLALALNGSPGNLSIEENLYQSGLLEFDMANRTFTNVTSLPAVSPGPRKDGHLLYVPNFGPSGIFVSMGGYTADTGIDFTSVLIYDPAAKAWYNQSTTGTPPTTRAGACAAGVASNSSYEIFLYGGTAGGLGDQSIQYDTINVLSLPGFNWISVQINEPSAPRFGHVCAPVGGSQIIVVGGADADPPITTGNFGDVQKSAMSSPDPNKQGLAIFDMQALEWADKYNSYTSPYVQSGSVQKFYSTDGGNYKSKLMPGVATLMAQTNFSATAPGANTNRTNNPTVTNPPTHTPTPTPNHAGAIAGGVVGGLAGVALIAGAIFFLLRRQRQKRNAQYQYSKAEGGAEMPAEPSASPGTYWSPDSSEPGGGKWVSEAPPDTKGPAELEPKYDRYVAEADGSPMSELPQEQNHHRTVSELPT